MRGSPCSRTKEKNGMAQEGVVGERDPVGGRKGRATGVSNYTREEVNGMVPFVLP